jgi:hypothetical protein
MVDVIQSSKSDAQRIADRLKGSNDTSTADTIAHHGTGPTRTITTVHRGSQQSQHGPSHSGEGNIVGGKR